LTVRGMEITISRFVRNEKSSEPSNIVTEAAKGQIRGTGDDRTSKKNPQQML
jgi:hypothetical protein